MITDESKNSATAIHNEIFGDTEEFETSKVEAYFNNHPELTDHLFDDLTYTYSEKSYQKAKAVHADIEENGMGCVRTLKVIELKNFLYSYEGYKDYARMYKSTPSLLRSIMAITVALVLLVVVRSYRVNLEGTLRFWIGTVPMVILALVIAGIIGTLFENIKKRKVSKPYFMAFQNNLPFSFNPNFVYTGGNEPLSLEHKADWPDEDLRDFLDSFAAILSVIALLLTLNYCFLWIRPFSTPLNVSKDAISIVTKKDKVTNGISIFSDAKYIVGKWKSTEDNSIIEFTREDIISNNERMRYEVAMLMNDIVYIQMGSENQVALALSFENSGDTMILYTSIGFSFDSLEPIATFHRQIF